MRQDTLKKNPSSGYYWIRTPWSGSVEAGYYHADCNKIYLVGLASRYLMSEGFELLGKIIVPNKYKGKQKMATNADFISDLGKLIDKYKNTDINGSMFNEVCEMYETVKDKKRRDSFITAIASVCKEHGVDVGFDNDDWWFCLNHGCVYHSEIITKLKELKNVG